jgi:hypothetical protein
MEPAMNTYSDPSSTPSSFTKKRLIVLGVLVLLVIVCIGLLGFGVKQHVSSEQFKVVSTTPATSNVADVSPSFSVTYTKPLSKNNLSVTSSPSIITSYGIKGSTLDIDLAEPLTNGKRYTITVTSITDTTGKKLLNQQFTFKPKYVASQNLPSDQQQALLKDQQTYTNAEAKENPIVSHLPYSTLDFSLTPTYQGSQLILQAQILLAPGVTGSQAAADTAQYEQQVTQYIQSLGLNPANYTIQYQIVNETLGGAGSQSIP